MKHIIMVEDDEDIRELTIYALRSAGFEAEGCEDGGAFWETLNTSATIPDLVLLDIMLPGRDGLAILKMLRSSGKYKALPVIMLTAKGSEYDKVKGLDAGADDYIAKPFGVMELIARIGAVLRRSASAPSVARDKLTYGRIVMDNARHAVFVDGESTALTFKEYEMLRYLMLNADIALSRDRIMEAVWGYDFEGESRTVDMHIKTLRQKLGTAGEHIKTVRNIGYKIGE